MKKIRMMFLRELAYTVELVYVAAQKIAMCIYRQVGVDIEDALLSPLENIHKRFVEAGII